MCNVTMSMTKKNQSMSMSTGNGSVPLESERPRSSLESNQMIAVCPQNKFIESDKDKSDMHHPKHRAFLLLISETAVDVFVNTVVKWKFSPVIIKPTRKKTFNWQRWINVGFYLFVLLIMPIFITANGNAKIGDRVRSKESSFQFFSWVDRDGDGVLRRKEVESLVRNSIGGSEYDSDIEVNSEVEKLMAALDQNNDQKLDLGDVFSHWNHVENLLTVKEVYEWLIYSLQLPESVASAFVEHSVTGYDFPELIENDGEALEKELGIEKSVIRKKIVRSMRIKLLGMGSVPESPIKLTYRLESCTSVELQWQKPYSVSYPVHSYRVQRRAIARNHRSDINTSVTPSSISSEDLKVFDEISESSQLPLGWVTVYVGPDMHYLDSFQDDNFRVMYRVQAWNAIGHSEWVLKDISSSLKRKMCNAIEEWQFLSFYDEPFYFFLFYLGSLWKLAYTLIFKWIAPCVYHSIQTMCTFLAGFGVFIRYKRASDPSSFFVLSDSYFPWFWRGLHDLSVTLLGKSVVPDHMINISDASAGHCEQRKRRQLPNRIDQSSRNVLYRKSRYDDQRVEEDSRRRKRKISPQPMRSLKREHSYSTRSVMPIPYDENTIISPKRKTAVKRFFSRNSKSVCSFATDNSPPLGSTITIDNALKSNTSSIDEFSGDEVESKLRSYSEDNSLLVCQPVHPRPSERVVGNDQHCEICTKSFKFGKRWKHHCSRCLGVFCHKHGRVTHKNYFACKVPGDCICRNCLEKEG